MARFFDYYTPLEKRYLFNSFLVVAALVEVLILVFTLIWQVDEGIFADQVKVVPFPWTEYLLASFTAPIVLLFLFGLLVWGFDLIWGADRTASKDLAAPGGRKGALRWTYLLILPVLLVFLLLIFLGKSGLAAAAGLLRSLGLAGAFVLAGLIALGFLCLALALVLRYRLKKKALEYQYLLHLAQTQGMAVFDPETARKLGVTFTGLLEDKNLPALPDSPASPPSDKTH